MQQSGTCRACQITLRRDLLRRRSLNYLKGNLNLSALLDNCTSFTDFKKMRICRPSIPMTQVVVHLDHGRMYCLIYQTINEHDLPMVFLYEPGM